MSLLTYVMVALVLLTPRPRAPQAALPSACACTRAPALPTALATRHLVSTVIKHSAQSGAPSATQVVMWFPNAQTVACATEGNVAGVLSVQLHLVAPSLYQVWHEWTEVREMSGHGGQRLLGRN
ncbi:MAG: hypothetical protein NZT92_03010 [Abditibacteriales bacterium]|nr:hypothetical protein [Abditibacteriales bacterium]